MTTNIFRIASLASVMLIAQPVLAADATPAAGMKAGAANKIAPRNLQDNAYVNLSGTVGKILGDNSFELNYKGGTIKVTTDETWRSMYDSKSANALRVGQRVFVSGVVDDNWFSRKEIDAYSVRTTGTDGTAYSYNKQAASGSKADDTYMLGTATQYFGEGSNIMLSGIVSQVDGEDFWLRYSGGTIKVDGEKLDLPDNRLRVGDRVSVQGEIEDPFFQNKQIEARTITFVDMYPVTAKQ